MRSMSIGDEGGVCLRVVIVDGRSVFMVYGAWEGACTTQVGVDVIIDAEGE